MNGPQFRGVFKNLPYINDEAFCENSKQILAITRRSLWRRSLSYRNQCKSMGWFLHDKERINFSVKSSTINVWLDPKYASAKPRRYTTSFLCRTTPCVYRKFQVLTKMTRLIMLLKLYCSTLVFIRTML